MHADKTRNKKRRKHNREKAARTSDVAQVRLLDLRHTLTPTNAQISPKC